MTPADLLTILPRGPEYSTDVATLAYRLGSNDREVREAMRMLVVDDHQPINTRGGVYLARTQAELQPTINDLWSRFLSLKERIDALGLVVFEDGTQLQLPI